MKILTLFDGTIQSKAALRYGLRKVREKGGELTVLQVFQSGLFVDYEGGPKAEEIARAEASRQLKEAEALIRETDRGVAVNIVSEEGDAIEELVRLAKAGGCDLLLATPRYKAITKKTGCPVYIMPGTILVPVDSSDSFKADLRTIAAEAADTGSQVLLLGIVPVHLYSAGEQEELELINKKTLAAVNELKKALKEKGLASTEIIRSGYPDEEILKAAEEHQVSLIMLPAGGKTPSELTKAAAILLDEPERVKRPLYLMTPNEAV